MNSVTRSFYDHMPRQLSHAKSLNMNGSNYDVVSTFNIGFNSFFVKIHTVMVILVLRNLLKVSA